MKVKYMKWESGQGLEEVQAKIYTEVSGLPARAEQIGPRNVDLSQRLFISTGAWQYRMRLQL